jgi:hypothetical protein
MIAQSTTGVEKIPCSPNRQPCAPQDPLDPFGGKNLAEGETLARQKGGNNPTKTAADSSGRFGYLHGHEKTLLGFSPGSEPRRASSYRHGQGLNARSTPGLQDPKKSSSQAQGQSPRSFPHDSAIRGWHLFHFSQLFSAAPFPQYLAGQPSAGYAF